jgi:hypothetical protein
MDHCSAHVIDDVIRILTEASVRAITFAPHRTQIFQDRQRTAQFGWINKPE